MKQLVGSDIGSYTFNAATKQITLIGVGTITLNQILTVTNTTSNTQKMIYCFADETMGGSLAGNVLTLDVDTTTMNNSDSLQIYIDLPNVVQPISGNFLTDAQLRTAPVSVDINSQPPITITQTHDDPNKSIYGKRPVGQEGFVAPFGYSNEEMENFIEPSEQIPVAVAPAFLGIDNESRSQSVALAKEQIQDLYNEFKSFLTPPAGTVVTFQDCLRYRQVSIQISTGVGVSAGVVTFECSNDLTSWVTCPLFIASSAGSTAGSSTAAFTANASNIYNGPIIARFFRARVSTTVVGGYVHVSSMFRMVPYSYSPNVNLTQLAGNTLQTGATGLLSVGGNQTVGTLATGSPVPVSGVDSAGRTRRFMTDSMGNMMMAGMPFGIKQDPMKVIDQDPDFGRYSTPELLEMILMELKLQSFYLKELPMLLNMPGGSFIEDISNFTDNVDKFDKK